MANINMLRGNKSSLPSAKVDGNLYFCIDSGELFMDYVTGSEPEYDECGELIPGTGTGLSTRIQIKDSNVYTKSEVDKALADANMIWGTF